MPFIVDIPDWGDWGTWVQLGQFKTRKEAIAFCKKEFETDNKGRLQLISEVTEEELSELDEEE